MQTVLINGIQCLFAPVRRSEESDFQKRNKKYPYVYDIRHDDQGDPRTVEKHVLVNHFGTIMAPVSFLKHGMRMKNGFRYAEIDICKCGCGSPSFLFMSEEPSETKDLFQGGIR